MQMIICSQYDASSVDNMVIEDADDGGEVGGCKRPATRLRRAPTDCDRWSECQARSERLPSTLLNREFMSDNEVNVNITTASTTMLPQLRQW